jgi:hypothetical protein
MLAKKALQYSTTISLEKRLLEILVSYKRSTSSSSSNGMRSPNWETLAKDTESSYSLIFLINFFDFSKILAALESEPV